MESLSIKEIARYIKGELLNLNDDILVSGISTDSRKIKDGDLFVALKGKNFDGNDYVEECLNKGAVAAVVTRRIEGNKPMILVEDGLSALKEIAKYYKSRFKIPVVAVTGSTGKTSTKEIISSVLEQKFKVHKTFKNFNNEIGLPLTIFELERCHNISVLEMGMNNPGEIQRLAEIGRPDVAIITNIGTAHIENLKSRENILKAKLEITSFFNENSLLVVNGDDEYLSTVKDKVYTVKRVSTKGNGDYNAYDIQNLGENGIEFKCVYRGEEHQFKILAPGMHNVYNALAAIAVGDRFDLSTENIKDGLLSFKSVSQRMDVIALNNGIKIINDCYNANLDSMKAALDVLSDLKCDRKIAVLGDMFELGDFSFEAHKQVGKYAQDKCSMLIAVGKDSIHMYNEAVKKIQSHHFNTKEEACQLLKDIIKPGDAILVKASRGMNMEHIVNFLISEFSDRKGK